MDIKLRAKLSAYSLVDTFEPQDNEHNCKFMTPVTPEQIDRVLFTEKHDPPSGDVNPPSDEFADFVNSLFAED